MPYYVTIRRDSRQWAALAGPYGTQAEAQAMVPAARTWAIERDTWAEFDAFGTAKIEGTIPTPWMNR